MKIALLGYGAMNRLVEAQTRDGGDAYAHDEITLIVTSRERALDVETLATRLRGADVAIDFSVSDAVLRNIAACAAARVPLVEGTTGWNQHEAEARKVVAAHDAALVYAANFSLGVNLFYRLAAYAGELFARFPEYDAFLEEAHHARKRDAPSGTALRLRASLAAHLKREVSVASTRAGHIPGTHTVGFDARADQITLTHTARSREGFAAGALLAARWVASSKKGFYEFSEVIAEILQP